MHQRVMRARRRYETTIDRAGIALGVGSLLSGAIILVLLVLGGQRDPLALLSGWMLGVLLSACAITAVAGPLWLAMHVAGLRRARHAALVGAVTAMAVFVGAQTYGFALQALTDDRTWLYRLASAVATSALLAAVAALIGVAMWRVAYRPREDED
jgi:MFS family permease